MRIIAIILALVFVACAAPKSAGRCTTPDCRDGNPNVN